MRSNSQAPKAIKNRPLAIIIFVVLLCSVAYYFFIGQYLRFKENIELENGETIVVDRKLKTNAYGEVAGPGGWEVRFNSMVIVQPENSQNPPIWETEEELLPVIFDRDPKNNEWFVVSIIGSCALLIKLGRLPYPYVEDRFREGKWKRVKLSPELIGRKVNVFPGINARGERSPITVSDKFTRMNEIGIVEEYRRISKTTSGC